MSVMSTNPSLFPGDLSHPVSSDSWFDACRLVLPAELEQEITVVKFSLPGKEALRGVLGGIMELDRLHVQWVNSRIDDLLTRYVSPAPIGHPRFRSHNKSLSRARAPSFIH